MDGRSRHLHFIHDWDELGLDTLTERGNKWAVGLNFITQLRCCIIHIRERLLRLTHIAVCTRQSIVGTLKSLYQRIGDGDYTVASWSVGGTDRNQLCHV